MIYFSTFFFIPSRIVFIILFYKEYGFYYNKKIKSSFKNKIKCLLWPSIEEDGEVPSSNESEAQPPLQPQAPDPPLQTLTFWSES